MDEDCEEEDDLNLSGGDGMEGEVINGMEEMSEGEESDKENDELDKNNTKEKKKK